MIAITSTITRRGTLTLTAWRDVSMAAWRRVGEFWHRVLLPKHFGTGAAQRYGYQDRHPLYERKKQRRFGHRRPLEYRGYLKRDVTTVRDVRTVRASSKAHGRERVLGAVKIVLHGPKYLYQYRKDLRQPDKAAELQAINAEDERTIAAVLDRELQRELDRLGGAGQDRRRTRRRSA